MNQPTKMGKSLIKKTIEFLDDGYCCEYQLKHEPDGKFTFDGLVTSYYPSGNIFWTICFVDGREHGPYVMFWKNGNICRESNYNYGVLDGEYKDYDEDGLLRDHSCYVDGKKISLNDYKRQIGLN